MKFKIETYEDYLNLSLSDENKISDDDFDLYTDTEIGLLNKYNLQFQLELSKIKQSYHKIVIENNKIIRPLLDKEFYNWPHKKILAFFKGEINE